MASLSAPLVLVDGMDAADEEDRILVAVIFGGLISSLALALIILPVLYTMVNRRKGQPA